MQPAGPFPDSHRLMRRIRQPREKPSALVRIHPAYRCQPDSGNPRRDQFRFDTAHATNPLELCRSRRPAVSPSRRQPFSVRASPASHATGSHNAFRFATGVPMGISQPAPTMQGLPTRSYTSRTSWRIVSGVA